MMMMMISRSSSGGGSNASFQTTSATMDEAIKTMLKGIRLCFNSVLVFFLFCFFKYIIDIYNL